LSGQGRTAEFPEYRFMAKWLPGLLATGAGCGLALVVAGWVLSLLSRGAYRLPYKLLASRRASYPTGFAQLYHQLLHHGAPAVGALGLLVLVATPVARVVMAFLYYACRRQLDFAAITLAVLALLALGGVVGFVI
jgi:uncharacterized membrane protein